MQCQCYADISMHLILLWTSFYMKYYIKYFCHGGDQPVALLKCSFWSSASLVLVSLVFLAMPIFPL